ncbi:hypothetical protein FJV82_01415 [Mesorhizobium sp. WSM4305]|nr:hypothetical protein FJV82_01415 [Mesorhizobium sp. WSM4305]
MPVPSAPQRFTSGPFRRATPAWRKGFQSGARRDGSRKRRPAQGQAVASLSRSRLASAALGLMMACAAVTARANPLSAEA